MPEDVSNSGPLSVSSQGTLDAVMPRLTWDAPDWVSRLGTWNCIFLLKFRPFRGIPNNMLSREEQVSHTIKLSKPRGRRSSQGFRGFWISAPEVVQH